MADKRKYVQGIQYRLYGSGIGSSDTSIRLTSMTLPNSGELVTMSMFGEKGYATIEPGNRSREENISFTGITQNIDGSATLTGVVRGIELVEPYTQDLTLRKSHAGGVAISITNSSVFYSDFANKYNDEVIEGKYTFPSTPGVDRPVLSADTNSVLAEELVTKGELNRAVTATFLAPIIIDSSSATTGTSTAGSLTWAHVSSGDNRLLTVQIATEQDKTITGVTYNGDALTQAASHTRVTGDLRTEIWYLIAPDLGTNNIIITASSAAFISATALTLNSVNQTTPIGITGDADGSSTTPSVAVVTTQVNSLVVDSVATESDPTTFTAGSNQSIQQSVTSGATRQIATSVESVPVATSTTMNYTISPTGNWAITTVEILGITGGGGGGSDNYTVKATAADTTPSFLDDKITLISSDNSVIITKTINNPAGNEEIEYDLSALGGSGGTKLAIDTTQVVVTSNDVEETLYTVAIPGGTLGDNDAIRFSIIPSTTTIDQVGDALVKMYYGGTLISSVNITSSASTVSASLLKIEGMIVANNATNTQKGLLVISGGIGDIASTQSAVIGSDYGTSAIDSTISQNLLITIELEDTSDQYTAEAIIVEKISSGSGGGGSIISLTAGEDLTAGDTVGYASFIDDTAFKAAWAVRNVDTDIGIDSNGIQAICRLVDDTYAILTTQQTGSVPYKALIGVLDRDTNTWTFGIPTGSITNVNGGNPDIVRLDDDKFATIIFDDTINPYEFTVTVFTVSGTTITTGNTATYATSTDNANNLQAVQLDTDRFALVTGGSNSGSRVDLFEVTVSGTTPTIGTVTTLDSTTTSLSAIAKIDTDKVAIINDTSLWIATVSGGVWTVGTPITFTTPTGGADSNLAGLSIVSNATDTLYISRSNNANWRVTYFTVSGTVPTQVADTSYSLVAGQTLAVLATDGTDVYAIMNSTNVNGIAQLSISGANVVFSNLIPVSIGNSISSRLMAANQILDGADYFGITQADVNPSGNNIRFNYYVQGMTPYFIGIAQNTVSRGGSVQVKIAGVDENQTGLTAGALYDPLQGGITPATTQGVTTMVAQSATKLKI